MNSSTLRENKTRLRRELLDRRGGLDAKEVERQSAAIISYAVSLVRDQPADRAIVATYHPMVTEPGGSLLVEALRGEARTLYLPITEPDGVLRWAEYLGPERTSPGVWGIAEPTGPSYGTSTLTSCSIVFVPALAVNSRGIRLGKGGGYYDRTLAELATMDESNRPLIAVLLFDDEITDSVPTEAHDMAVDLAVTPHGITRFNQA